MAGFYLPPGDRQTTRRAQLAAVMLLLLRCVYRRFIIDSPSRSAIIVRSDLGAGQPEGIMNDARRSTRSVGERALSDDLGMQHQ